MIKLTIFIIALLLAVEAIEPDAPWLVTLGALSGLELLRWPFSAPRRMGRWMRTDAGQGWSESLDKLAAVRRRSPS